MPLRLAVPTENLMQTFTVAVSFDDSKVSVNASSIRPFEASLGTYYAINADDTNAVRLNSVWASPTKVLNRTEEAASSSHTVLVTVLDMEMTVRSCET